jgi:hypothetical protein
VASRAIAIWRSTSSRRVPGRSNFAALEGKTALTRAELLEAEQLADQLNVADGVRDQGPVTTGATAAIRSRAYTLFIQAYNGVRRAVQ